MGEGGEYLGVVTSSESYGQVLGTNGKTGDLGVPVAPDGTAIASDPPGSGSAYTHAFTRAVSARRGSKPGAISASRGGADLIFGTTSAVPKSELDSADEFYSAIGALAEQRRQNRLSQC